MIEWMRTSYSSSRRRVYINYPALTIIRFNTTHSAETAGFEPAAQLPERDLSRVVVSPTHPHLQIVPPVGLEPTFFSLGNCCSNPLSYEGAVETQGFEP